MPFGSFFKKVFKKGAGDLAGKYGGEQARDMVEDALGGDQPGGAAPDFGDMLSVFTGNQASGLQSLFGAIGGSSGGMEQRANDKGMDPNLINSIVGMLTSSGAGGASGGSGFNMGTLVKVASSLTKGGSGGGGGIEGFLALISGGGGSSGSSGNILQVLIGLAKSFFAMQMGKNKSMSDWGDAGTNNNKDDDNFGNWGGHVVKDLIDPGKKDKDRMDDDPNEDKPTGGDDNVKGWFDGHPEIGKMQKDVFDDIFDTTDEDDEDRLDDDPTPLIPAPKGFEPDCTVLDQASILFLNTNILLDLRKEWRFLYSFKTHSKDGSGFIDKIELMGPTIVLIRDTSGNMFGVFTSTSWADSEGGWIGNGDSFIFAIKPKMAVFHATGKDDNIMFMSKTEDPMLGLGGRKGRFGLSLNRDLASGSYHEDVDTFDLPPGVTSEEFEVEHVEVWGLGPETDPDRERSKLHVRKANTRVRGGDVDMGDLMDQIM